MHHRSLYDSTGVINAKQKHSLDDILVANEGVQMLIHDGDSICKEEVT